MQQFFQKASKLAEMSNQYCNSTNINFQYVLEVYLNSSCFYKTQLEQSTFKKFHSHSNLDSKGFWNSIIIGPNHSSYICDDCIYRNGSKGDIVLRKKDFDTDTNTII